MCVIPARPNRIRGRTAQLGRRIIRTDFAFLFVQILWDSPTPCGGPFVQLDQIIHCVRYGICSLFWGSARHVGVCKSLRMSNWQDRYDIVYKCIWLAHKKMLLPSGQKACVHHATVIIGTVSWETWQFPWGLILPMLVTANELCYMNIYINALRLGCLSTQLAV